MKTQKENVGQTNSAPAVVTAIKLYQVIQGEKNRDFIFEDYEIVRKAFKERLRPKYMSVSLTAC